MSRSAREQKDVLRAVWAKCLVLLLSRMTSAEWLDDSKSGEERQSAFWLNVKYEGGIAGQHWFGFGRTDLEMLLRLFVGEESTVSDSPDEMQWEGLEELTRQWAGLVASELKGDFGEVSLTVGRDLSHSRVTQGTLLRASDGSQAVAIQMEIGEEMGGGVAQAESLPIERSESSTAASDPPPARRNSSAHIEELLRKGNLDLLMDVELGVMLRFGRRQTTLHEVLDLTAGAVLELDREIQEPVDLVLNERVIARGEVMVVDGNYGLRVTEVATPQQRVDSL